MRVHIPLGQANAQDDLHEGSVSVEFALGLVAVMSVLAMILAGIDAAHAKEHACQLAREGARHAARQLSVGAETLMTLPLPEAYNLGRLTTVRDGQWVRASARWPLHSPVSWLAPDMKCEVVTLGEEIGSW